MKQVLYNVHKMNLKVRIKIQLLGRISIEYIWWGRGCYYSNYFPISYLRSPLAPYHNPPALIEEDNG